jgi:cell division control protein 6
LNCQTLQFNSYNAPQLEEILSKRVEQAFKPGTVPDEVLGEIAEQVAENSGDCREALEKLLRAGRKADQTKANRVSNDMLEWTG